MERTDVCGGSFNFSTPAFLRYERSRQSNKDQPCIWVIWANSVVASSIKIRLLDLNGQLRIYNKFHIRSTNQAVQNWYIFGFIVFLFSPLIFMEYCYNTGF